MKVLIKGAGDLASGIALRLHNCGFDIAMTELSIPTTVRRTVAYSPAVYLGKTEVEGVKGVLCKDIKDIEKAVDNGEIAVVSDENCNIANLWKPDIIVDAIIAKRNIGTHKGDAPVVIGVGPGFTANYDCDCVIETMRGHNLGRCIWQGRAAPNTGVPGKIEGYDKERIIRASADGTFKGCVSISDSVHKGDIVGYVVNSDKDIKTPIYALIDGVVRGLLQDNVPVRTGMKSGDIDPRNCSDNCFTVSDKARAIAGGVLEAIIILSRRKNL